MRATFEAAGVAFTGDHRRGPSRADKPGRALPPKAARCSASGMQVQVLDGLNRARLPVRCCLPTGNSQVMDLIRPIGDMQGTRFGVQPSQHEIL